MTPQEKERRAVERLVAIADRIEEFRMNTEGRKMIPKAMLQELRMARKQAVTAFALTAPPPTA
jgi:hypothetical protein